MKIRMMFVVLILLSVSCINNQKEKDSDSGSKSEKIRVVKTYTNADLDSLINVYSNDSNIDIRIAALLYSTIKDKPYWHSDSYQSFCLQQGFYINLIDSLFYFDRHINQVKNKLSENRLNYIEKIREIVREEFKEYGYADGMDYSFLISIKDSTLKPILEQAIDSKLLTEKQRKKLVEDLNGISKN